MSAQQYDAALHPTSQRHQRKDGTSSDSDSMMMRFPVVIGRALQAKGYTRVRISVTDAGLLLKPYTGDRVIGADAVELPEWS